MNNFLNLSYSRRILNISIPAIIGVSSQIIISLVDTAMVGRLDDAKTNLAAMGIGVIATWAIVSFFSSLSAGAHILIARKYGEKDYTGCRNILYNSIFFSLIFGILITLLIYFGAESFSFLIAVDPKVKVLAGEFISYRFLGLPFFLMVVCYRGFFFGIGDTKIFMASGIMVNVLNVFLNYILIYGNFGAPQLGLKGAAIASSIATTADFFYYFFVTYSKKYRKMYFMNKTFFKINFQEIIKIIKLSLPVSFQNIFVLTGFLGFIAFTGLIGTLEQAASQTVISSIMISIMPCFGFGIAAQTLIGNSLGDRKPELAYIYGIETAKLAFIFTMLVAILFTVFPKEVLSITTSDQEVIQKAVYALRIAGLSQLIYGFAIVLANALQSAGDTFYVMKAEIIANWFVFIPFSYFLGIAMNYGYEGIWLGLPTYLMIYSALISFRYFRGQWRDNKL